MELFSVFENIENWPFYDQNPVFLSFGVSAITLLLINLLINVTYFWNRLLNAHFLTYQTVPLSIFEFLSLGTPKSQKSRKSLYFLYLHKINIYISKICKKKVRGKWYFCCTYLLDETSIENILIFEFFFLLFWGPEDKYSWFHKKGTFGVHSFNYEYLSIPERPCS